MAWLAINSETGEIKENVRIIHEEQLEGYSKKRKADEKKFYSRGKAFYFVDQNNFRRLVDMELTNKQVGQYLQLATYADFDGTLLTSSVSRKPLKTQAEWGKVLGLKSSQAVKKLRETFIQAGLIYQTVYTDDAGRQHKAFTLNPDYTYKGQARNKRVIKAYSTILRTLYEQQGAAAVGFVGKLLPCVNFDNVLTHNPFADVEQAEPLSFQEMAEMLSYNEDETRKMLNSLQVDGMDVFRRVRVNGKRGYMLNPALFYRKGYEATAEELEPFAVGQ